MKKNTIPANDDERIAGLYQLQILDTQPEKEFDNIVALASQICHTPIATISFVDQDREWWKAKTGVDFFELSRDASFCSYGVEQDGLFMIPDALLDERFSTTPLVTNYPNIRFYAGMPVKAGNGIIVGQLSVMDVTERSLTTGQITGLGQLADQVTTILTLRSQLQNSKIKEPLSVSAEQGNPFFQKAVDAIIVLNNEGVITACNPKAEIIFGWTKDEMIGKSFNNTILAGEFRGDHARRIKQYTDTGEELQLNATVEVRALGKNNIPIDVDLGISPAVIKSELSYICFISDNREHTLARLKLDKQKEFYENILNKIPTDIAVFDINHKYQFVNPGAIRSAELRKYIIGKDDFEYAEYRKRDKSIAEKRREKFLEVKSSNKEIRWEDSLKDPNGNTITHLRRLFPVHDEEGNLILMIGFGIDITERKIMEEKQSVLVKQLSAQNTQLVDFCNIVSHNLRAPLANMSMLVKFIEESNNNEERGTLIAMLNPVIENLHTTFNELVESIQIKQNLEIESEKVVIDDCVKRTLNGLELEIKECGASIDSDFKDAPVILYPSKYLYSIFHNLITNALKYHEPSRKSIIKLKTEKNGDTILLTVTDNGLGIDLEKHRDNIFKIGKVFHRHPNAKGFGLFMTKTQVEAGGGKIWVESTPGEGTTFFITFINQEM